MGAFELLDPELKNAMEKIGLRTPTEPQEGGILPILQGKNVLLIAPTGTGKTEAAILPVFHKILNQKERKGISAVYVTPLRALNRDMLKRLDQLSKELGIKVQVRHGDTPERERRRQVSMPPDLLITTPETFQILLVAKKLRDHLKQTRFVIVDEIHELADSKRGLQLSIALERLSELSEVQRIGLSATVGGVEEVKKFLGGTRKVEVVDISVAKHHSFNVLSPEIKEEDEKLVKKLVTEPENAAEIRAIREIIEQKKSVLVFVNTRQACEALGARLKILGMQAGVHHSSLSKEARIEVEDAFKKGELKALVCTSSMELGIDIGHVDHVVQYHSPREVTRMLQRVGRSGHRAGEISSGTIITSLPDDIAEASVIARRARHGEIEPVTIYREASDVIANQICAMALEYQEVKVSKILEIIKRTYPFNKLSQEKIKQILDQLQEHRLIFYDEKNGTVRRSQKAWQYYYENLSMIPDEKRYEVYDTVRGRSVASLDEAFVINFAEAGAVFITKGEMWRIIDMAEKRIKVEPVEHPQGEIPRWSGEEIPVPFEVAQEVGELREKISIMAKASDEQIAIELQKQFPVDEIAIKKVIQQIKAQIKQGCQVPTHDKITIEAAEKEKTVIINACFGHKVNETIGRVISSLLSAKFGSSVALETDPYRIRLELPKKMSSEKIAEVMQSVKPEYLEPIIEMTLKNSSLLKWKIVHVARKFGALRKDVDHEKLAMDKFLDIYEKTPLYEEAVSEIYHDKLDIARAREVFTSISAGKIQIAISGLSPIGLSGYTAGYELLFPEKIDQSIVLALKNRILNDRIILFCLNCRQWKSARRVIQVPEQPECPLCSSRLIAALKPWEDEEIRLIKKQQKTGEEKSRAKRVFRNANLVLSHGKQAVIALAARGLGPEIASRIMGKIPRDEEEFYREILKAERQYIKTKKFWDL